MFSVNDSLDSAAVGDRAMLRVKVIMLQIKVSKQVIKLLRRMKITNGRCALWSTTI